MEINTHFNNIIHLEETLNSPQLAAVKEQSNTNQKTQDIAHKNFNLRASVSAPAILTNKPMIEWSEKEHKFSFSPSNSSIFSTSESLQKEMMTIFADSVSMIPHNGSTPHYVHLKNTQVGAEEAISKISTENSLRDKEKIGLFEEEEPVKMELSNVILKSNFSHELYWNSPDYRFTVGIGKHAYNLQGMGLDSGGYIKGRGGFGRVFLGVDETGKQVAVKVAKGLDRDDLEREGQFLLKMQEKKYVIGAEECGLLDNKLFVVMKPMNGGELLDFILEGNLSFKQNIQILLDSAKGVKECHDANILHRDIKPENIMIEKVEQSDGSKEYRASLIDLGLATTITEESKSQRGTAAYIAPEVVLGKVQGPPCDVFSFGQVIYSTLTGKWASTTDFSKQEWRKPWGDISINQQSLTNAGIPDPLVDRCKQLVENCLKWYPAERPNIQNVISELEGLLKEIT